MLVYHLGGGGSPTATLIKIKEVGSATFSDMYISNAVVPQNGLSIDVKRSNANKVTFNNCVIKGKSLNLNECRIIR